MNVGDLVKIRTWGNQDCPGGSVGVVTSAVSYLVANFHGLHL